MNQVNERTTAILHMAFTNENKTAVIPTSFRYQIVDSFSGQVLTPWTAIAIVASSYDLTITQENNAIIDELHDSEVRIVSIVFEYGSGPKQGTGEFRYEVVNLHSIPPSATLECSGGAVIGGSSTAWEHS